MKKQQLVVKEIQKYTKHHFVIKLKFEIINFLNKLNFQKKKIIINLFNFKKKLKMELVKYYGVKNKIN